MNIALALRKQELALEKEVEMEQRVLLFVKEREIELMTKLEEQLSKRSKISEKEINEVIKSLESEIKVKLESILIDTRQSILETHSSED
jgi:hypothetical protein